ncbi:MULTISPECIES: murein hydrolase activator EnvC family protein [unclassified Halorhodospira]|uniref:murein hydrolase activator EnvC family protein n=1 Tax=unclassified Halorhodospira TaxID=2626748 RepID=UPI001EE947C5|nr:MULTISPECIES: peptidoglycan DD-metalloendopeptidase family protein [unclassified Halorhodospira]MCG5541918.1 peptidoglycan DD-metalloendopeptidase family protein [Halorhodospira sp. M39old]MCG5546544.1 peptidoglycan DD-metalloendopeptidase family protein [Halorhodospira sp. M38]
MAARRPRTGLAMGVVLMALAGASSADYESEREQLEALRDDLETIQEQLAADRAARDEVEEELSRLERVVSEAARELERLREERAHARERVAELREDYEAEAERLGRHRETLAAQIVAAYVSGGDDPLRLLLNQQDPAAVQRLLVYHDYFNEARAGHIEAAMAELQSLAALREELRTELTELERLEQATREERQALAEQRAERDARREQLEARIAERGAEAESLEAEVAEQESLLEDLRQRLADVPDEAADFEALSEARGSLPWPVGGEVAEEFGEARGGGLQRTGVVIAAQTGEEVHAVAPGRVVFSDWLRGLGLLAIIDHGDGHLTLYGHTESLYVDVGEWVEAGDLVATVGNSGTRREPGLYFEIREGAEPRNPLDWLR